MLLAWPGNTIQAGARRQPGKRADHRCQEFVESEDGGRGEPRQHDDRFARGDGEADGLARLQRDAVGDDARVAQWMTPSIAVLDAQTRLPLAAKQALLTHAALIVVVVDGQPRGVVTATDMVYALI